MNDAVLDALVIGGGAAGFFAAITCAELRPGARVAILERNRAVLGKVRISGGGRCNVTHACFDPAELAGHYPRGGAALRGPFTRFQPRDTMAWFENRGVALKTESDGRVFPVSDDSATIVNCLSGAAARSGVNVETSIVVERIERAADARGGAGFVVGLRDGRDLHCARLLLATGGSPQGQRWAAQFGHAIVPPVPSLFTFEIEDARLRDLAGVTVGHARVALVDGSGAGLRQEGPLLVTHWGLSGPAVLRLSAWGARLLAERAYQSEIEVSWLPDLHDEELRERLTGYKRSRGPQLVAAHSPFGQIPHRLWQALARAAGIHDDQRWAKLARPNAHRLAQELLHGRYRVCGKGAFKEEFVTCGGVELDEVNFKTMESRIAPGLYFAGEILDIDGLTGGFNFQNAWTTGWLAGRAMAQ